MLAVLPARQRCPRNGTGFWRPGLAQLDPVGLHAGPERTGGQASFAAYRAEGKHHCPGLATHVYHQPGSDFPGLKPVAAGVTRDFTSRRQRLATRYFTALQMT